MAEQHPILYSSEIREIQTSSGGPNLYVLHGIFGSGRNWASVIRRFVHDRPEWSARLVDLRQHGSSQGFAPPHTISAAAADIVELARHHHETPTAILGHSFGGKVALAYARDHGGTGQKTGNVNQVRQVWVIDSTPEARAPDGSAWQMLELIRSVPREFGSREELVALLTRFGIAIPTAQWMATNLERDDASGRFRWRFDFDALDAMLRDFFTQDLWSVLENPPGDLQIHIVKARESSVLSPAAVQRIRDLEAAHGRVFFHEVDGGHWVNAENPGALLALMTKHL